MSKDQIFELPILFSFIELFLKSQSKSTFETNIQQAQTAQQILHSLLFLPYIIITYN